MDKYGFHPQNNSVLEVNVESSNISAMKALEKFQQNPRVINVRLIVAADCCPACQANEGTYEKNDAPQLPIDGCSHAYGCRCFFQPMLNTIYP
jgi:hypothetical protein